MTGPSSLADLVLQLLRDIRSDQVRTSAQRLEELPPLRLVVEQERLDKLARLEAERWTIPAREDVPWP